MSTKAQKSMRKIVIKNFNQNNILKQLSLNKNFPKIKLSNEMLIHSNINTKAKKLRSQTHQNLIINDSKSVLKNNSQKESVAVASYLNKTPKNNKKGIKYILKTENGKSEQNRVFKTPIISKKISFSDIYKLPTILNNDYKTLKLHLSGKKSKTGEISCLKQKTLNQNIHPFSNNKASEAKEMKERIFHGLSDITNNVDINIIDYNKICVKKNLRPINIINRITSPFEPKKIEENLQQYMKDRYYCDTEAKMEKKLKHTIFKHDNSLKEKIIKMKKISGFWGGLADYCIPIFTIRKFEYIKERLRRRKSQGKAKKNSEKKEQKIKYEIKPSRLFTINSFVDYRHQKNLEIKKEFIEKYNDSLEYYMM